MPVLILKEEFSVSSGQIGSATPDIAALSSGGFAIVWRSPSALIASGGDTDIVGATFTSSGSAIATPFIVNTDRVFGNQRDPMVTSTNDGFLVAWQGDAGFPQNQFAPGGSFSTFDLQGRPLLEFQPINLPSFDSAIQPTVTTLSNGNFAFAWAGIEDGIGDGNNWDVFTIIVDSEGNRLVDSTLVPMNFLSAQLQPAIADLGNGQYVVLWEDSSGSLGDNSASGIKGRLFSPSGAAVGSEFLVNQITSGSQSIPSVSGFQNGGFVATWQDSSGLNGDVSGSGISAQRFNAAGNRVGPQILVNTVTTDNQSNPQIASFTGGGFVVVWEDSNVLSGDGSGKSIKAQVFNVNGLKVGSEILVNDIPQTDQFDPTVTILNDGSFVISWISDYRTPPVANEGRSFGLVQAKIYSVDPLEIDGSVVIIGTSADETLRGTSFNDRLEGNDGNDILLGFFGDDILLGGSDNDYLIGEFGDDLLNGGAGLNRLQGGAGNDIYVVSNRGDSTTEFANEGTDEVRTSFTTYALQNNIENLTLIDNGAHGAAIGNVLDNVISGGTGADSLFGREGNDILRGGMGAANTLLGQQGDDIYVIEASGDSVIENAGEGIDTVQTARSSFALRAHVENLVYTGDATFTGIGAIDNNSITGGAGADFLSGLDGNDILVGKSGADTMLGGNGADQFRYEGGETGLDRITDFVSGTDKIALLGTAFARTATIDFVSNGTPAPTSANSTFLYNVNNGIVSYDADGTGAGAAVAIAQLNAGLALTPGDFIFY